MEYPNPVDHIFCLYVNIIHFDSKTSREFEICSSLELDPVRHLRFRGVKFSITANWNEPLLESNAFPALPVFL